MHIPTSYLSRAQVRWSPNTVLAFAALVVPFVCASPVSASVTSCAEPAGAVITFHAAFANGTISLGRAKAAGLSAKACGAVTGKTDAMANRSQLYQDIASGPFFGANRPGAKVSQGMIDSFWLQGMQAGHKNTLGCIQAFSETDFTDDLKQFDMPTLIIHGDDGQIVPIGAAALSSAKLVKDATLKIYPGAPHGHANTHKVRLNADLLAFLNN